jgi:hypothetical protein
VKAPALVKPAGAFPEGTKVTICEASAGTPAVTTGLAGVFATSTIALANE